MVVSDVEPGVNPVPEPTGHAAMSALFDQALPEVYGYVRRRTESDAQAEDVTATAFLRATSAVARGHVNEPTIAYVITIARNLLVDHWRRQARTERVMHLIEDRPILEEPWQVVDDAAAVEAHLTHLDPVYRSALTLRYLDDLTTEDVAEALGRSTVATESLLARARRALRHQIERTHEQGNEQDNNDAGRHGAEGQKGTDA